MPYPQKQPLFVPFGGLASDIDDKLLPLGHSLEVENAFVRRRGPGEGLIEVIKRYGTTQLPAFGNTGGQLGTHLGALVNVGTLLAALASTSSTACISAAQSDLRPAVSAGLTKVAAGALTPDVAMGGGFYWIAYQDSVTLGTPTLLRFVAVDTATGHRAFETSVTPTGGATGFSGWRVVYCAGRAVFVWHDDAGALHVLNVDPASSFATSTAATAAATTIGGPYDMYFFDVMAFADTRVVVAFINAALNARAYDVNPTSLALTAWTPQTSAGAAIPINSLGWIKDTNGSGKLALITAGAAAGLRVQWDFPASGATRNAAATHVIDAGYAGAGSFLTGATTSSLSTGDYVLVYDESTAPGRRILRATRLGGSVSAGALVARGVSLVSKPWTSGGDWFVVGNFDSTTQGTQYVLRVPIGAVFSTPVPVCKIGVRQGNGGSLPRLSDVVSPSAGRFTVALNYTPRFETQLTANFFGVELATITHHSLPYAALGCPIEAVDSMFSPGGTVGQYDGARFAEAGFAYSPEQPTLTPSAAGGSMTAAATYYYVTVYRYTDAQGRIWRSAPSIPKSVVMGGADNRVTVAAKTLRLTGRSDVVIEAYRGIASDTLDLHLVGTVANDVTVDSVNIVDTASDGAISSFETLYSTGNVLDNDTPPGFLALTEAQNRTWGWATDDPSALWYSKEHVLGRGIEWSEALVLDVRDQHGPGTTVAQLDGRPLAFKADAVYAIGGAGPDVLGNGGSYSASRICNGIGTANAQSVLETRDGVMFKSTSTRAGFFIVDRGLDVKYIGGPVQRYDAETITSAAFLSTLLQARFYTSSGRTLVYDLVTGTWVTFTGQPATTAIAWNGVPVYVSGSTGHALLEDQTHATLTDDALPYEMLVGGPWVQVNQYRGYMRFWKQLPAGEVERADVMLNMRLYRDQATVPFVTARVLQDVGVLDAGLRYSAKLGAVRTVITDGASTAGVLRLSGITYELGVRPGLRPERNGARAT